MGRKYQIRDQDKFYFVTFTVVQWLDIFTRDDYRTLFLDSIRYCQKHKGLLVGAWCIMTNHIHMILGAEGTQPLEHTIRDMKTFTSRQIRGAIEKSGQESRKNWLLWIMQRAGEHNAHNSQSQLWQQHSHPIVLDTNTMIDQRLDYIHNNPVAAGFVSTPEDWVYSSARDYAGEKGLLELVFLE